MKRTTLTILVTALLAGPVLASQPQDNRSVKPNSHITNQGAPNFRDDLTPPTEDTFLSQRHSGQLSTDELIGLKVVDARHEDVGKIDALVVDGDGRVSGAVLSIGGVLGVGDKRVGVSWNRLDVRADEEVAVLHMTKSQLDRAPEFESRTKSWIERQIEG